jgi:hypothetical protein
LETKLVNKTWKLGGWMRREEERRVRIGGSK